MTKRVEHGTTGPTALPPVERWLVDGFNVLHAVVLGGEPRAEFWSASQRARLIDRLARGLGEGAAGRAGIVVVFDGQRPLEGDAAHPAPALEVVFAPSADEWIVKHVRRAANEAGAVRPVGVVSNDRQVAGRCRHAGAPVVAPAHFMSHFPATEGEAAEGPSGH